jgi:hypothetical protein
LELRWEQLSIRETVFVQSVNQILSGFALLIGIPFDPGLQQGNELSLPVVQG